jgi:hypothetical protein
MDGPVLLSEIITGMDCQLEDSFSFLDQKTGAVVTVSREELSAAEEEKPLEQFPVWQQDCIETAGEILETDDFIALPSQFDIDEYNMMVEFCDSLDDGRLSNIMHNSIRGRGAFRRFKDNIHRYDIAEDWYRYRDESLRKIAIVWCEENGINYVDDTRKPARAGETGQVTDDLQLETEETEEDDWTVLEKKLELAKNMLLRKEGIQMISEVTGLPPEIIKCLKRQLRS